MYVESWDKSEAACCHDTNTVIHVRALEWLTTVDFSPLFLHRKNYVVTSVYRKIQIDQVNTTLVHASTQLWF